MKIAFMCTAVSDINVVVSITESTGLSISLGIRFIIMSIIIVVIVVVIIIITFPIFISTSIARSILLVKHHLPCQLHHHHHNDCHRTRFFAESSLQQVTQVSQLPGSISDAEKSWFRCAVRNASGCRLPAITPQLDLGILRASGLVDKHGCSIVPSTRLLEGLHNDSHDNSNHELPGIED